jgi:16S rRNA (cytosine967-C5)-methyltransferase
MNEARKAPELWRQLQATVEVLLRVTAGQSGTSSIDAVDASLRPAVQALAFHAWRNNGRAVALRTLLAQKPPALPTDTLLCLALGLMSSYEETSYDEFTLVNQTVQAAKQSPRTKAQANFINACLRRFQRERDALLAEANKRIEARWNHPLWWIKRVQADHPDSWERLLSEANRHPPMTLRVNRRKVDPADYLLKLQDAGVAIARSSSTRIELAKPLPVHKLPGFEEGWVSVQDGAAQYAAPLLLDGGLRGLPLRVLDACAAPGGKTAHLLEMSEAQVIALEVDPQRAERIGQTLGRLGLTAKVLCADASKPATWWDGELFGAILLDAPCTASGIVRRHPDIRWLRRESDIQQLAFQQKQILDALWPLLAAGGRLLYCTCSIFKAEGDGQVQAFLASNKDARLMPSPGHLLPGLAADQEGLVDNQASDHDGFFYALFEKMRP